MAEGYEPAADALYRSLASYEALGRPRQATSGQRRRLGVLTRWNNDPTGALSIHEALLRDTTSGTAEYARILTEIAWDRIQFVSWNRRYDHPWLQQAHAEAEQAVELLMPALRYAPCALCAGGSGVTLGATQSGSVSAADASSQAGFRSNFW